MTKWQHEALVASLKISEIHFSPIRPRGGLIGFVSFVINDSFSVDGIGIHTRLDKNGIRLLYPTKHINDGSILNLFHPINKSIGEAIEKSVWEKIKFLCRKEGI